MQRANRCSTGSVTLPLLLTFKQGQLLIHHALKQYPPNGHVAMELKGHRPGKSEPLDLTKPSRSWSNRQLSPKEQRPNRKL